MLTEEQLEEARIELKRREIEKNTTIKRTPQIKNIDDLYRLSCYEGTEAGEFWDTLHDMRMKTDFLSAAFIKALDKEIGLVIKFVKENYLEVVDGDGETIDLEFRG